MAAELPADGTQVTARTYESIEYDRPAEEVTGALATHPVEALGYVQCWVGGVQVDPATVRPAGGEGPAKPAEEPAPAG
jgi:hypothetical protein